MRIDNNRFIERSIIGALGFIQQSLFAEEYASRAGFLQAREIRIKVVSFIVSLIAVMVTKSLALLCGIYVFVLFLALVSSLDILFFLKRTWLFIPFFALCVAVPAIFSFVTPGDTLAGFKLFSIPLGITRQGVFSAGIFFMRVLTSVSLSVLLVLTSRHTALLGVLRSFRVPRIFVLTIAMCHRYIYLLIDTLLHTHRAVKSRAGSALSLEKGQRMVTWNIAALWQRSYSLHYQVFAAMVSRGYTGDVHSIEESRVTGKDVLWLAFVVFFLVECLWQTR